MESHSSLMKEGETIFQVHVRRGADILREEALKHRDRINSTRLEDLENPPLLQFWLSYTEDTPTLPPVDGNGWVIKTETFAPVVCLHVALPAPNAVIELTK